MRVRRKALRLALTAALALPSAAICARAQKKVTTRPGEAAGQAAPGKSGAPAADASDSARYTYEFKNPNFVVRHIRLAHDAAGRGTITFERKNSDEPITEPLSLSHEALRRVIAHWEALKFLDSAADYQSEKQFPHLGTVRLSMRKAERERDAEFNWSHDPDASGLANEYRRASDQAIAVFELNVARENQPLETPKLVEHLDRLIERKAVSDAAQLIPLLRDLSTDERIPLVGRNRAEKVLKRLEKEDKKKEGQ